MHLVVFHYHDRPGGVRQVISRGLPALVKRLGGVDRITLLLGEFTDTEWAAELRKKLPGVPLRIRTHHELGYLSDRPQQLGNEALRVLEEVLFCPDTLCWAHNLSVGRNIPLLRALPELCRAAGAELWLHHHDWWWDGRWRRWADWRAGGIDSLEEALELTVPCGPGIRHWCANRADLGWLRLWAGGSAEWAGSPPPDFRKPAATEVLRAGQWLAELGGGRQVWLAPVRALRRKNLAEALWLAKWQDRPTVLVTTGTASSDEEVVPWRRLKDEAARRGWPLIPQVLAGKHEGLPSMPALMAAADAVVMTSLQEGFGLPCLEAGALGRPVLTRIWPGWQENLGDTGLGSYARLPVEAGAFDRQAERARRLAGFKRWSPLIPGEWAPELQATDLPEERELDFGELSLDAQMEVMSGHSAPGNGRTLAPAVPFADGDGRGEDWARRFSDPGRDLMVHAAPASPAARRQALEEVDARFQYWLRHPLLWL